MAETANIPFQGDLFFQPLVDAYVKTPRFIQRDWLADEVDTQLADLDSRFVLLIGGPGAGKSTFMAQLAAHHAGWPRYFIRRDQRTALSDVTASSFLLRIGYQFAVTYPDLFKQDLVKIGVEQRVGSVEEKGEVIGAEIKRILASPFHQKVLEIQQNITRTQGRVVGLRIEELVLDPRLLKPDELANMALFDPARALLRIDPTQKIVILIDALDEIRYHNSQDDLLQWLINSPDPPPNLRFVLSSRPPDTALQLFCEKKTASLRRLSIEPSNEHVQTDVQKYVEHLITEPELTAAFARNGPKSEDFKIQLALKAHGNMGYLDSLARAIDNAIIRKDYPLLEALLKLENLPNDLESLYAFFLHQIKGGVAREVIDLTDPTTGESVQKKVWPAVYTRMLGVLAVAMEPLSLSLIKELGGIATDWEYLTEAIDRLRPFLDLVNDRYRLYHSSVAEFLTADTTRNQPETADLYIDPRQMHQRIAAYYLRAWGGLEVGLPGILEADRARDYGYGLRNLVAHLATGGQGDTLHRLLRISTPEGRNVWYKAKTSGGIMAGYRNDILRAWRLAEEESVRQVQAGEPAISIGDELRYALILSTLSSLANNMPPSLLVGLVSAGTWSCEEGLAYARQIPDPVQRVEALADLAENCSSYKESAFREAIATAENIVDIYWREATIAQLATRLPVELRGELTLGESREISALLLEYSGSDRSSANEDLQIWDFETSKASEWLSRADELTETQRVELLLKILPELTGPLLQDAFTVAKSIREEFKRTIAITGLVLRMVEVGDASGAKDAVTEIAFLHNRAQALSRFISLPTDSENLTDSDNILTRARSIADPHWRAAALAAIASGLPREDRQVVIDEAWLAAQTISDGESGNEATVHAAAWLGKLGRHDQAQAIVGNIRDANWRALGLVAIAHLLPDEALSGALNLANGINDPYWHSLCIAALNARSNGENQPAYLIEVINSLRRIPDETRVARLVNGLGFFIPDVHFQEIIREALALILAAKNEYQRAEGIAIISEYLPESLLRQALEVARELGDEKARSTALASIFIALARHGCFEEALELAKEEVVDEHLKAEAFNYIAEYAIAADKAALSIYATKQLKYEHWQSNLLIRSAAASSTAQISELVDRARSMKEPRWRAITMAKLHPYLPENQQESLLAQALAALQTMKDENELGRTLNQIAPILPLSLINQAIGVTENITSQSVKGAALAGLLIGLAEKGLEEDAYEKTHSIKDPYWRAYIFIHLSSFVSASRHQDLWVDIRAALEKVTDLEDGMQLSQAFNLHLRYFSTEEIYSFWRYILRLASSEERGQFFAALTKLFPILAALGGSALIIAAANGIREVSQWWPWSEP